MEYFVIQYLYRNNRKYVCSLFLTIFNAIDTSVIVKAKLITAVKIQRKSELINSSLEI